MPYYPSKTDSYKDRTRQSSDPEHSRPGWRASTGGEGPDAPEGGNRDYKRASLAQIGPPGYRDAGTVGIPPLPDYARNARRYNPPTLYDSPHNCNCPEPTGSSMSAGNPVLRSAAEVRNRAHALNEEIRGNIDATRRGILSRDIPLTAGAGKYSQQSIRDMAMSNASVRDAMMAGKKVVLVRDNVVGGRPVSHQQVLANAGAGGSPAYVRFTGPLNPDGSPVPGKGLQFTFPDGLTDTSLPTGGGLPYTPAAGGDDCHCHADGPPGAGHKEATGKVNMTCSTIDTADLVKDSTRSTGTVGKNIECPEPEYGRNGYFYITDKEGESTHHAAKEFFAMLNKTCGGLFELNSQTGMVWLKKGKKKEDIDKLQPSNLVSRELAWTVHDATIGGVKINGSTEPQVVRMRVLKQGDEENDNFILDDFNSGFVDLDDYQDLMKRQAPQEIREDDLVKPLFEDSTGMPVYMLYAFTVARAICERYRMEDYEKYISQSKKISLDEYKEVYRLWGDARACVVLKEMVKAVDEHFDKPLNGIEYMDGEAEKALGVIMQYIPSRAKWVLGTLLYSSADAKKRYRLKSGYLQKNNVDL